VSTIRDQIAAVVTEAERHCRRVDCRQCRLVEADAVLEWLGRLDPDADVELIAWHLRNDQAEIERLRALVAADVCLSCKDVAS
jgi:hypothetical protein